MMCMKKEGYSLMMCMKKNNFGPKIFKRSQSRKKIICVGCWVSCL